MLEAAETNRSRLSKRCNSSAEDANSFLTPTVAENEVGGGVGGNGGDGGDGGDGGGEEKNNAGGKREADNTPASAATEKAAEVE